jgi:hypothetical protein
MVPNLESIESIVVNALAEERLSGLKVQLNAHISNQNWYSSHN